MKSFEISMRIHNEEIHCSYRNLSGIGFVFASLAELALVGFLMKDEGRPSTLSHASTRKWNLKKVLSRREIVDNRQFCVYVDCVEMSSTSRTSNGNHHCEKKLSVVQRSERVDQCARFMFPGNQFSPLITVSHSLTVIYSLYNFLYWGVYMRSSLENAQM